MKNNCVVLEYQEDFTDNFSVYAYGKIIEKKSGTPCFYENSSNKRIKFEAKMNNFNLDIKYIC